MITQLVTHLLSASAPARAIRVDGGANWRMQMVCRSRRDGLRHLSTALLLLALSALIVQPLAHAGTRGHFVQHDAAAAAMTQPCPHSLAPGGAQASDPHCNQDPSAPSLLECCQACPVAAIAPQIESLSPRVGGDHPSRLNPDHFGRTPSGILRPPRLIAAA